MRKTANIKKDAKQKPPLRSFVVDSTKKTLLLGVPCSRIADKIKDDTIHCPNENIALSIAAGAILAGEEPIVYMQNSGLGRSIDILTSLYLPYEIPYPKIILSIRHSPKHHSYIGEMTKDLLEMLQIVDVDITEQEE